MSNISCQTSRFVRISPISQGKPTKHAQMRENANKRRKHQPCITEISPHHAPPASTEERGSAASGEA